MRSNKSRSRNKSNRNNNNRSVANVVNRVFDSSGPEGKVRGTPQQIIEKYNQLARDSQLSGDRVATENFQQHAEHYLRLLGEAQKEQDAKREQQERENRERQQERDRQQEKDRERAKRQERESAGEPAQSDPAEAPQPDVLEPMGGDSGLVETPESQPPVAQTAAQDDTPAPAPAPAPKPKRARKPRVPKPAKVDAAAETKADTGAQSQPQAEGAPSAQDAPGTPESSEAAE